MKRRAQTIVLDCGEAAKAPGLVGNLSAAAAVGDVLWTASDEGRTVERLARRGTGFRLEEGHRYALDALFPDLPGAEDGDEADIESLTIAQGRLWICGSHCRVRGKAKAGAVPPAELRYRRSRHLLGWVGLTRRGEIAELPGTSLPFKGKGSLRHRLKQSPHLRPFLSLPSKENGLDVEGVAVRGRSLLIGLRGPVIDGFAVVAALPLATLGAVDRAAPRLHFLDLGGLAVRDLAPLGQDILVLAGPVADTGGPFRLHRWQPRRARGVERAKLVHEWPQGPEKPEGICALAHGRRTGCSSSMTARRERAFADRAMRRTGCRSPGRSVHRAARAAYSARPRRVAARRSNGRCTSRGSSDRLDKAVGCRAGASSRCRRAHCAVRPVVLPGARPMTRRFLLLALALQMTGIAACGPSQQGTAAPQAPSVTVATPTVKKIVEWDEYTGRFEAIEFVEVRARVSGYLESIHFDDGQIVEKGDLLFVIDKRPFEAALDRARGLADEAQARLQLATEDRQRAEKLLKSTAGNRELFDQRLQTERATEASLKAAQAAVRSAELDIEFAEIRAPVQGRISDHRIGVGNLVSGGASGATLLTTIASLDPIHFSFDASEKAYIKYVRLDQAGDRPSSRYKPNPVFVKIVDETSFAHEGQMNFVDNVVDPRTGTMRGRAILPNPDGLFIPGLFGRLRLAGSNEYEAILVPEAAIQSDQSHKFVWVVNAENVVEYRPLTLGPPHDDGLRIVRQGLGPSDRIVVDGVQRVRPGLTVAPEQVAPPVAARN